jgi:hypothetical protein
MRSTGFCYPDEEVVNTRGDDFKDYSKARDQMFLEALTTRCHSLCQTEQATTLCDFNDILCWSKGMLSRVCCPHVLDTFDAQDSVTSTARRRLLSLSLADGLSECIRQARGLATEDLFVKLTITNTEKLGFAR